MEKFVGINLLLIITLCGAIQILTVFGSENSTPYVSARADKVPVKIQIAGSKIEPPSEHEPAGEESLAKQVLQTRQVPQNRWNIQLSPEEKDLIARITMLEAGGESDQGQQAVVEVILNRIHSGLFPNTVYEVLSQEANGCRQFVSWKNRNSEAATPTARVIENMEAVLNGKTNLLPFETLYFSVERENEYVQCVIGGHVFCNQPSI